MGCFAPVTRRIYESGLRSLERGDLDALLKRFHRDCVFIFVGDTPLGAQLSSAGDIRRWFERFSRLLPNPRFEVQRLVITGPPWKQRLASHTLIRSVLDGQPYQNQFAQFLTIRFGKVVEDLVLEDTQTWERACRRLAEAGLAEAGEPPISTTAAPAPTGVGTLGRRRS